MPSETSDGFYLHHLPRFAILQDFLPGATVLQLGAGAEYDAQVLTTLGAARVVNVSPDASPVTRDRSHRDHRWTPERGISSFTADYHRLPFPDRLFDVVFASEALTAAADLTAVLAELKRVLSPEGFIVLSLPNFQRDDIREVMGEGTQRVPYRSPAELYDALSQQFAHISALAQAPFFGYSLLEQRDADEPARPFTLSYELMEGRGEKPLFYVFLASELEIVLEEDRLVQVPFSHLVNRIQEGLRLFHRSLERKNSALLELREEQQVLRRDTDQHRDTTQRLRHQLTRLVSRLEDITDAIEPLLDDTSGGSSEIREGVRRLRERMADLLAGTGVDQSDRVLRTADLHDADRAGEGSSPAGHRSQDASRAVHTSEADGHAAQDISSIENASRPAPASGMTAQEARLLFEGLQGGGIDDALRELEQAPVNLRLPPSRPTGRPVRVSIPEDPVFQEDLAPFRLPGPVPLSTELRHELDETRQQLHQREAELRQVVQWRNSLIDQAHELEASLREELNRGHTTWSLRQAALRGWEALTQLLRDQVLHLTDLPPAAVPREVRAEGPADHLELFKALQGLGLGDEAATEVTDPTVPSLSSVAGETASGESTSVPQVGSGAAPDRDRTGLLSELEALRAERASLRHERQELLGRLEALQSEHQSQRAELEAARSEHDTRTHAREHELLAREQALLTREQALGTARDTQTAEAGGTGQEALGALSAALRERELDIAEREHDLTLRDQSFAAREQTLLGREQSVARRQEQLAAKEQELAAWKSQLAAKEQTLASTHADVEGQVSGAAGDDSSLQPRVRELEARHARLIHLQQELEVREGSVEVRETLLTAREAEAELERATAANRSAGAGTVSSALEAATSTRPGAIAASSETGLSHVFQQPVDEREALLIAREMDLSALEERLRHAEQRVQQFMADRAIVDSQLAQNVEFQEEAASTIESWRRELEAAQALAASSEASVTGLKQELEAAHQRLAAGSDEAIAALQQELDEARQARDHLATVRAELEARIEGLYSQHAALEAAALAAREQAAHEIQMAAGVDVLQTEVEEQRDQLTRQNAELETLRAQLSERAAELEELRGMAASDGAESAGLAELEGRLSVQSAAVTQALEDARAADSHRRELEQRLIERDSEIAELKEEVQRAWKRSLDAGGGYGDLAGVDGGAPVESIASIAEAMPDWQTQLQEQSERIEKLQKEMESRNILLTRLHKELDLKSTHNRNLQEIIGKQREDLDKIKGKIREAIEYIGRLHQSNQEKEQELDNLRKQLHRGDSSPLQA